MTPRVAFCLVPRSSFQIFSGHEGLSRRTYPGLTLYSPHFCCRLIALEMAKIHAIQANGSLPKPFLWHKMHHYFTLVKDKINPRYRNLRGHKAASAPPLTFGSCPLSEEVQGYHSHEDFLLSTIHPEPQPRQREVVSCTSAMWGISCFGYQHLFLFELSDCVRQQD